jgi:hypothetical protein
MILAKKQVAMQPPYRAAQAIAVRVIDSAEMQDDGWRNHG